MPAAVRALRRTAPLKKLPSRRDAALKRRAADIAYDRIECLFATLALAPDTPVVEADLAERVGLGRTPVREALMRLVSVGLIVQQPRRGLRVSSIDLLNHLDVLQTRRSLERLIATSAARRATQDQRRAIVESAQKMVDAAARGRLDGYMTADQQLDNVIHAAARNASAAQAVEPLVVRCRRFWYAYQHQGDIVEGARCHLLLAEGIHSASAERAAAGADGLLDYLEAFARRVIDG